MPAPMPPPPPPTCAIGGCSDPLPPETAQVTTEAANAGVDPLTGGLLLLFTAAYIIGFFLLMAWIIDTTP